MAHTLWRWNCAMACSRRPSNSRRFTSPVRLSCVAVQERRSRCSRACEMSSRIQIVPAESSPGTTRITEHVHPELVPSLCRISSSASEAAVGREVGAHARAHPRRPGASGRWWWSALAQQLLLGVAAEDLAEVAPDQLEAAAARDHDPHRRVVQDGLEMALRLLRIAHASAPFSTIDALSPTSCSSLVVGLPRTCGVSTDRGVSLTERRVGKLSRGSQTDHASPAQQRVVTVA